MEHLRLAVLQGIASVHGAALAEEKISAILVKAEKAKDPRHYAFMAGRNAAISAYRRQQYFVRKAMEEERRAAQEQVFQDWKARLHSEIIRLAMDLPADRQAGLLSFVDPSGLPGLMERRRVSQDVAYQWRCRGIRAVLPRCSSELREALRSRSRRLLLQAA